MKRWLIALLMSAVTLPCAGKDSVVYVGANYTYVNIEPKGLASFDGSMGGMQGLYQYRPLNCIYMGVGAHWRYGSNHGNEGKRDLLDADIHERIGYTLACRGLLVTLYSGFGYRHLSHHLKPNSGTPIKLYYNEFYVPLGLLTEWNINPCLCLGLNAVWMPQVYPTVAISRISDARWALRNTYANVNVGLPLTYRCRWMGKWRLVLKPYFEFWQDGSTKSQTSFGEPLGLPKNTYTFWGIDLNVQCGF
jgi:hypothetical protein